MAEPRSENTEWRTIVWIALPVLLAANLYLMTQGGVSFILLQLAFTAYQALLAWLTIRVTRPRPTDAPQGTSDQKRLWAQTGVIAAIVLITALGASRVPLWSSMTAWFHRLGEAILPVEWFGGPGNAVANPVQYFVIPLLLLLLLGARPAELGFGKGHKAWQVSLIWAALPLALCVGLVAGGAFPLQTFLRRIIGNTFQNGFFEEFLFRGALQTRLSRLVSAPRALTIQAVIFGLWHLNANTQSWDGNLLAGLAACLASQTVTGFVLGLIFHRTGNLLAPSVAHVMNNVLGQTFG